MTPDQKFIAILGGISLLLLMRGDELEKAISTPNPVDRYQAFHGVPASKKTMVEVPIPGKDDMLVKIGDLERIEYTPTGTSRRKNIRFYHDSGKTLTGTLKDKAVLAASNETGHLFIVPTKAGYPKFRAEGIIG